MPELIRWPAEAIWERVAPRLVGTLRHVQRTARQPAGVSLQYAAEWLAGGAAFGGAAGQGHRGGQQPHRRHLVLTCAAHPFLLSTVP